MTDLLLALKKLKHAGHIGSREVSTCVRKKWIAGKDAVVQRQARSRPYVYRPDRYQDTFLSTDHYPTGASELPNVVWCIWSGGNEMSENRLAGLESLYSVNADCEVRLVTPDNLAVWILPDAPLHPAYYQLSFVHRSDYLRCYLLHFYGGGYCDIKTIEVSWKPSIELLLSQPEKWILSFREGGSESTGQPPGMLGKDVRRNFPYLVGAGLMVARSQTRFTADWWARLNSVLDEKTPDLQNHPGGVWGEEPGYPLVWTEILGMVVHPLQLKYNPRLIADDRIKPQLHDYK